MTESLVRRFWDTCVFTAIIRGEAGRADICRQLLSDGERGQFVVATSALTLAEMTRHGVDVAHSHRDAIEKFFDRRTILVVPIDRFTGELAREIVFRTGLKAPDAIQVAAAIRANCLHFETYDGGILKLDGSLGIPIRQPFRMSQTAMFDEPQP